MEENAERARASDTNAAAVELRAAAEKARKFLAPSTPRAAYRQPTIEDAIKFTGAYYAKKVNDLSGDDLSHMLAALNSIGAVIAEEVPK